MTLELDLMDLHITQRRISGGRIRLTVDYPNDEAYRDHIMTTLATLLRPKSPLPRPAPDTLDLEEGSPELEARRRHWASSDMDESHLTPHREEE